MIDITILVLIFLFLLAVGIHAGRKTNSVADFMVASRCAGRYMLSVAEGEAAMGAITVLYLWENFTRTGWTDIHWKSLMGPIMIFISVTGWINYRFRATRAMTLAEFFEMRYSRKFRIYSGFLCWFSGILNFGIFPAVAGRFFICWFNIPIHNYELGSFTINLTLGLVMFGLVVLALFFTFIGGQITVLVTDFWQGLIALATFVAVFFAILWIVGWDKMAEGMKMVSVPGKSLYDPLDIADKPNFGYTYFAIFAFFRLYNRMSYQGISSYNSSAINPHEAKMAKIFGYFRGFIIGLGVFLIPMAAFAIMNLPEYSDKAAEVNSYLENAFPDNIANQRQMMVPTVLMKVLPVGLTGLFAAAMLGFFMSTNNSYMHSYGSIFVQDVIIPLFCKNKTLSPEKHLLLLRLSIIFVAIFVFFFSWLFPMNDFIYMFLQITGAVFIGGVGTVIIGGLYWKRGTTAAAWSAMTIAALMSILSMILKQIWTDVPFLVEFSPKFPYSGQVMAFFSSLAAIIVYVMISLVQWKPPINMDKLLHRGKYAVKEEEDALKERGAQQKPVGRFWKMIGVNSHEFSRVDKGVFVFVWIWPIYGLIRFVITTALRMTGVMVGEDWLPFWHYVAIEMIVIALIFAVWVGIGGLIDLRRMYQKLDKMKDDSSDDGHVDQQQQLTND